ncbi:MAG: exodeoxyribonuclease V subunit alpha [Simplicispira sp.]|nr:exodeoxyribonuclease V subunit alpha [Simplicispira sp.]
MHLLTDLDAPPTTLLAPGAVPATAHAATAAASAAATAIATAASISTATVASTLETLHAFSEAGWLRRLDSAMADFMAELDRQAAPTVLVATALLAHMEGRGHSCLLLAPLVAQPGAVLGWPAPALAALDALWAGLPHDLAHWRTALQASSVVDVDGQGGARGEPPLVLGGSLDAPRLYLRRYWNYERTVAQHILARTAIPLPIDPAVLRPWLERLFAPAGGAPADPSGTAVPDWQKLACALALRGRFSVITGGPGSGKTYTAARLLALLFATHAQPDRLRVALAAPTGKAAARLKQSIDTALGELRERVGDDLDLDALTRRMGAARTLHALLGARLDTRQFRYHAGQLLDIDVLIVDEASMVHLEMMAALLAALPATACVILLGDKDQLASVEAGAVLGDLCRDAQAGRYSPDTARYALAATGEALAAHFLHTSAAPPPLAQYTVMLRHSRRFGGPIGQLALAVNRGDAQAAQQLLESDSSGPLACHEGVGPGAVLPLAVQGRAGAPASYRAYLDCLALRPVAGGAQAHAQWAHSVLTAFERFRLLCAVREGEWGAAGLNRAVEQALQRAGLLQPRGEWYSGRPVMVTRNDPALGVFNGDIGIALAPPADGASQASGLRVYFADGPQLRSVGVGRLAHVETAFAMTVHKSQGSEFEHTVLVLPPHADAVLSRELVYTGITRARQAFTLVAAQPGLLAKAVQQRTQRASGLQDFLDG